MNLKRALRFSRFRRVVLGMIGTGFISNVHMMAHQINPGVIVKALSDSDQSLLLRKSRLWGVKDVYPDYHYLLKDEEIEVVDIMTPHFLHKKSVCDALEAGKTVICEKPLALSEEEVRAISLLAKRTGRKVYVKQYLRHSKVLMRVKKLLESGTLGEPYLVNCMFTGNSISQYEDALNWRSNLKESGGGVFTDIGVHILDLLQWYFGNPVSVFSQMAKVKSTLPTKGEDVVSLLVNYQHNILSTISCTHIDLGYGFRWEIKVYCTDGVIQVIDEGGKKLRKLTVIKDNKVVHHMEEDNWWQAANIAVLTDIINRIRLNLDPEVSLEDARKVAKIITAGYSSSNLGKKIVI